MLCSISLPNSIVLQFCCITYGNNENLFFICTTLIQVLVRVIYHFNICIEKKYTLSLLSHTFYFLASAAKFDSKAVFSAPCMDLMALNTSVPEMTALTVCTYIKLTSSDPWTAFTYRLPTSSINVYEFGILGDSSSLKIWMFGTQINVFERLNLNTWYEICVIWDGKNESMGFYLNGTLKVQHKLENKSNLVGGGTVILGCSHFKEINASVSVGLVGEMYMFRMWNTSQTSLLQKCNDGNVIKWKMDDWIYIPHVVQQDSTLHCGKSCHICFSFI